jgi:hypothetical protein
MINPAGMAILTRLGIRYAFYFGIAWVVLFFRRWNKSRRESNAQSWPTVQGCIISGNAKPIPKTNRHMATLTYSYCVGEYYSGKYTHEFAKEEEADDFIRQMRDKRILIRYKESKPSVSILEQSMVEQTVALSPIRG